ncbi:P-loop containing nucleoside triphosphate hydrolase protein [Sporodiniella umbellata]|nr:P-loop containing nucleoside triphosphate hydrolase protein [Sporodiniella umbellata]
MSDSDITIGIASTQAAFTALSAFILSVQRAYLHKTKEISNLRFDTKRKSLETNDSTYLTRLSFDTFGLLGLSIYGFYRVMSVSNPIHEQSFVCVQLVAWLYTTVLVLVAARHSLPSEWGWKLNIHLFILYLVAWCVSVYQFYTAMVYNPYDTFLHLLPALLYLIFTTDLVYTSGSRPQGPDYLDDNGVPVIGVQTASIFSFLYFNWASPLVHLAYKNQTLTDKDLPMLPSLFRGYNLFYIFGGTSGSLLKRIYQSNRRPILIQVVMALVSSMFYYLPAYFVNQLLILIQAINKKEDGALVRQGFVLVTGLGITIFVLGIITGQLWYFASSNVQVRIKAMLNVEIYNKTLRRRDLSVGSNSEETDKKDDKKEDSNDEENEDVTSSTGTIVNLMSTDSNRVSEFATWWWTVLEAPTELGVGIYFLYTLLGKSCFLGLLIMIVILPVNHYNAKMFAATQDKLMESRDKRISLMNEVLQGIRQIKFFAWETNWEKKVMEARGVELYHLAITYLSGVLFTLTWQGAPILVTLISFWSFTKLEGKELTAPIAFTSISVFNELRFALNVLPEVFIEWLQALISLRRIQTYLDEDEIDSTQTGTPDKIGFEQATVGWAKETFSDNEQQKTGFTLKDLDIDFPKEKLSLIAGATGSGKTLMMLSLLGEAIVIKGSVSCPRQPVADKVSSDFTLSEDIPAEDWILPYALAYVSQTAWLQNASIRDNILFGLPYVESRYRETLAACALSKDLEILEDGDQTEIGEKGITLSGGQKARVCLARAVYSRAQNVLMDDVLSAVDAHTAKHLYERCLMGPLMMGRTRILITHHVRLCSKGADYVVHLDYNVAGTPNGLRELGYLEAEEEDVEEEEAEEEKTIEETLPAGKQDEKKPRTLVEEESRASGMVKIRLYKMYIKLVGNPFFWLFMALLIFGSRGLDVVESWWIKQWSQSYETVDNDDLIIQQQSFVSQSKPMYAYSHQTLLETEENKNESNDDSVNFYLGVYCIITVGNIIVGTLRFAVLYWRVLGANKKLYQQLLHRVFRAPLRFFDTTPVGRILNRFSKDFETIDSSIPSHMLEFIIQWVVIVTSIFTVSTVLPIFLVPMLLVAIVNIYMGVMFVSASREFRRIDSVSRSPLFSHFTETIVGVSTIRAFGVTRQFLQQMLQYIDANSRPFYYTWLVNRWVSVRYAASGAIVNFLTGAIILYRIDSMNASIAGFCLSFVLLFTDQMFWGIRRYTNLEMAFNAVERVVEFMEIEQEAPAVTDIRPPPNWPTEGGIEVKDLQVRYAADLEPVLQDLNFTVKAQEKVGVVGRTGSGKSTLALSFFRFVEASKGSIVIDGIDIKDLGTEDLRSNLTIIPQDPTLFSGTLRSNMDPFDQFEDSEIFTALRRVHLLQAEGEEEVSNNVNVFKDLTTTVNEGGKNFSQGQRQLLCLARALLKRSRIVLMDEATASVDFETDKAIQKTISTEFAESTILCIAHRLHTVIEYDRILVLDKGNIVEFESPLTLIENTESIFHKMCRNSGEFDSLVALARSKHQLVDV